MVKLTSIYKDYEQGGEPVRVLKDINLHIAKGEYLAIMGPSGSGKSTLMNLLGCLDVPTSGEYELDGLPVSALDDVQLAGIRNRKIGFVFQGFNLMNEYDALDNVALPLLYSGLKKKERRLLAEAALRKVGLGDRLSFYPNQLSGGQQQRVAIARAVVQRPSLLLADEPTGALDSVSGSQLMDLFDDLHATGVTIVMITHEQAIADRARRIMYIRDGVLSAETKAGAAQ